MSLKNKIVRFVCRYQYPHFVYSDSIKKYLKRNSGFRQYVILDAPCGNGETTWQLSLMENSRVFGYDISVNSIDFAKKTFQRKNIEFHCKDIHALFNERIECNVICLINSLFMLPDQKILLQNIKNSMGNECFFFLIIPNVFGKNYSVFKKENPAINTMEHSLEDTAKMLKELEFGVVHKTGIVYTHGYNRMDARLFSVFASFYLLLLNYFQTLLKIGSPNYFMFVLKNK